MELYRTPRVSPTIKGTIMSPLSQDSYTRTIQNALPNVVRDIRKEALLTQKELAEQAGLSEGFVLRAEQYLHVELSDSLAQALSLIDSQSRTAVEIEDKYRKGRNTFLAVNSEFLQSNPYLRSRIRAAMNYAVDHSLNSDQAALSDDDSGYSHPFRLFRSHLFTSFDMPISQIKFCVFTGIHPTVVAAIESYRSSMEESTENALRQVLGMEAAEIATLRLLCDQAL